MSFPPPAASRISPPPIPVPSGFGLDSGFWFRFSLDPASAPRQTRGYGGQASTFSLLPSAFGLSADAVLSPPGARRYFDISRRDCKSFCTGSCRHIPRGLPSRSAWCHSEESRPDDIGTGGRRICPPNGKNVVSARRQDSCRRRVNFVPSESGLGMTPEGVFDNLSGRAIHQSSGSSVGTPDSHGTAVWQSPHPYAPAQP